MMIIPDEGKISDNDCHILEDKMKYKRLFLSLAILIIASLACGFFGGKGTSGVGDSPPSSVGGSEDPPSSAGDSKKYDTEFPLPSNVDNLMKFEDGSINYQTSMQLDEVVAFYRDAFAAAGYDERDITTVINEDTFSIVWDGHPSGEAIVVQGVDLGNGSFNVNVRFEDV